MIFVDTSALLPLVAVDDADHEPVRAALAEHIEQGLVTHEYVLVETVSLIQARHGVAAVRRFVDDMLPGLEVRSVDPALRAAALAALLAAERRRVSLVDWTSFLFMRDQALDTAFALDDDFSREGFAVVP